MGSINLSEYRVSKKYYDYSVIVPTDEEFKRLSSTHILKDKIIKY